MGLDGVHLLHERLLAHLLLLVLALDLAYLLLVLVAQLALLLLDLIVVLERRRVLSASASASFDGGRAVERHLAGELSLEQVDLLLELTQHGVLGILVDGRLVLDRLGAVGVAQRAQRLLVVVAGGRQGGDHQRLRVAAERVLEEARELRVAIRYVLGLAVDERRYDVAERRERQVDLGGLLEAIAGGARLRLALAARQVHQIELADLVVLLALLVRLAHLHANGEHGVRTRRVGVHERGARRPIPVALLHELLARADRLALVPRQLRHVHALVRMLVQVERVLVVLAQQVAYVLVVDLQIGGAYQVLLGRVDGDRLENVLFLLLLFLFEMIVSSFKM